MTSNQIKISHKDLQNLSAFNLMMDMTLKGDKDIDEHILTIFSLVMSMKPSVIIELGVRTARSTFPFLFAANLIDADVVSVDLNPINPDFDFPEDWKSGWSFHEKDAIKFLEEDLPGIMESDKVSMSGKSKIFYIDDWHSYEHVAKEINLISEFATSSDLIVLHDLMYYNSQPNYRSETNPKDPQWGNGGPYKAICELDLKDWEFSTIPRCNGLTILRKKASEVYTD